MRRGSTKNPAEAAPSDVAPQASTSSFAAVERFVLDVMPTVPGGRHLSTDTRGHRALIREAAAERGLTTKKMGNRTYFYDGRLAVGGMSGWVPTLVGREAFVVCKFKDVTKQLLEAAGLPTPAGIDLDADQLDEALAYVHAAGRPLVLKPTVGGGGDGITCGVTSENELRAAWDCAERAMEENSRLVLEEQVEGVDIRAFVVGRRVAAAATRVPAHVVGDGRQSIAELIDEKRQWRAQHATLAVIGFDVGDEQLVRDGRTVHDIPTADDVVLLSSLGNMTAGGEAVDVTDLVHPDLLDLAVEAVRAIPGLGVAGVDLLAPDVRSADGAVVLEANVGANIRIHNCPTYGQSRNVAGAIIDEMIATASRS
jgi:cyanophycin synthetase